MNKLYLIRVGYCKYVLEYQGNRSEYIFDNVYNDSALKPRQIADIIASMLNAIVIIADEWE